jgi:signal transduction histidine kinase
MTRHPKNSELELRLWALHPGAHICCLFESETEHQALLAPFMRHGLERYEKVLYMADVHTVDQILAYLSADGIEVGPFLQNGQLKILDADASFTRGGVFDPEGMIALLRAETQRAIEEGYSALRVSGEMSWALKGLPGSERLIEFEGRLNAFFPGSGCLALCQYDRRRFDPHVLLDALQAHPLAVIGPEVYDNFYYMPPQELLGSDPLEVKLTSWLDHLRERKRSETQIRTLTRKLMKTQEDERRMISRELHDRVSQDLSTIKIGLETLFDRQPAAAPEISRKVSRLTGLLDRAIFTVRDLAYDLRPPGLDEMGIAQAMVMYCDDFAEKTGIRVECYCVGIERLKLDFNTQINLYRMIQEGLNNTHKHAAATRAIVKLTAAYPNIFLRIEDDGKGFDVEKRAREIDSEKRMGLRSLQERTDLLGGIMLVTSKPGQGTKISIKFPNTG